MRRIFSSFQLSVVNKGEMSGKRLLKSMLAQTGSLNRVRQDIPSQASVSAGFFLRTL